jgi:diguanylate cyclase (GGDEF)-like protein
MFFGKFELLVRFSKAISLSLSMAILAGFLLVSMATIFSNVRERQELIAQNDKQFSIMRDQETLTSDAQNSFHRQVIEWQAMLLHGKDAYLFDLHFRNFNQAEKETQDTLSKLNTVAIKPYALSSFEVGEVIKEHTQLGQSYRSALRKKQLIVDPVYAFAIAFKTQSADEALSDSIDAIREITKKQIAQAFEIVKTQQSAELENLENYLEVIITSMVLLVLLVSILSFRKMKDSRTKLASLLTENARKLRLISDSDSLTRLPNRRVFQEHLQKVFNKIGTDKIHYGLMLLDFDHFKALNAAYGQAVGDMVLAEAGQRVSKSLKSTSFAARLSGDQCIIMISDLSTNPTEAVADAMLEATALHSCLAQPYTFSGETLLLTSSIGITLFNTTIVETDELLIQAEFAIRIAKKLGGNQISFFNSIEQQKLIDRQQLGKELDVAIGLQQMELFYQIQVDVNNHVTGVEALIRWMHPSKGMVSPADFIPAAEETGLILKMGQWVIDSACAQLREWNKDDMLRHLSIAVNVSARQFREKDFVSQVIKSVTHFGIDPAKLKLEITESMVLENVENTIQTMLQLREYGLRFAIDDFGTGYSSLSYLKRLPLDQLKIDQFFIRDLDTNNNDKAIVSTIISMAKNMQLDIIAEGVETLSQRDFLFSQGCLSYQGFYFAKPIPLINMEALAKRMGIAGYISTE